MRQFFEDTISLFSFWRHSHFCWKTIDFAENLEMMQIAAGASEGGGVKFFASLWPYAYENRYVCMNQQFWIIARVSDHRYNLFCNALNDFMMG